MRTVFALLIVLFLVSTLNITTSDAQDSPQWHLPEGATARLGKGGITGEIAYSPDGTRLAVAGSIGIWLYDAQTGEALDLLTGHTDRVLSVSFSPDGTHPRKSATVRRATVKSVGCGEHAANIATLQANIATLHGAYE